MVMSGRLKRVRNKSGWLIRTRRKFGWLIGTRRKFGWVIRTRMDSIKPEVEIEGFRFVFTCSIVVMVKNVRVVVVLL